MTRLFSAVYFISIYRRAKKQKGQMNNERK